MAKNTRSVSTFSDIPLFDGVEPALLRAAAPDMRKRKFARGDFVVIESAEGEAMYVILQGTARVTALDPQRDVFLALLAEGDVFGEMSLIDARPRSANVVAIEPATIMAVHKPAFDMLFECPAFARNLLCIISNRLRLADVRIRAHCTLDVAGKIARQLMEFSDIYGRRQDDGAIHIPVRVTQGDLADLVGASREVVNRTMNKMKDDGVISWSTLHHVTILKPAELRAGSA